jgi:demethylmenaquinone methyltransferase / 2-methoxy-6-polyprenyl-1,4-benzoquinol methylase
VRGTRATVEALPEGEGKARAVRDMFDTIAPRYDLLNRLLTFRMDVGWRRKAVERLGLVQGSLVLDLACGTGDLCRELAAHGHRPIGLDLSAGMLAAARTGAPLVQADVTVLPVPDGAADGITCGFALRNLVDLRAGLVAMARALRPGGRVALLEVAEPRSRLLRTGHRVYFGSIVPRIGALLSDGAAYRYLPRSVAYLPEPAALASLMSEAGFGRIRRELLSGGIAQLLTATRGT